MQRVHRQTQSTEKYLEAIFLFEQKNGAVRVMDIATKLGLQKGTVCGALKKLKAREWIVYPPYRSIRLTASGRRIAESVVKRNTILMQFLVEVLQMDPKDAEMAAGRMGHAVEAAIVKWMASRLATNHAPTSDRMQA